MGPKKWKSSNITEAMKTKSLPLLTPGEMLQEEFIAPVELSAYRLAKEIGVPLTRITAILAGECAITADTGLRLDRYFGSPKAGGCASRPSAICARRNVNSAPASPGK
jgi:addiction module HigA family antidote